MGTNPRACSRCDAGALCAGKGSVAVAGVAFAVGDGVMEGVAKVGDAGIPVEATATVGAGAAVGGDADPQAIPATPAEQAMASRNEALAKPYSWLVMMGITQLEILTLTPPSPSKGRESIIAADGRTPVCPRPAVAAAPWRRSGRREVSRSSAARCGCARPTRGAGG